MTLLERVMEYCRDYGISKTKFGRLALGKQSFVFNLERGCNPLPPTVLAVEEFMRSAPPQEHSVAHRRALRGTVSSRVSVDDVAHLRVNRDPCAKCSIRADIGCKHTPKGAGRSMYG